MQARRNPQKSGFASADQSSLYATKIELVPIDSLVPNKKNARVHSKRQIKEIARSIERFGFNNPILIDDKRQILAGHGRWQC